MKLLNSMICALLVLGACQPPQDNTANEAFEANSKIVIKYLDGFQNENVDYSIFAENALIRGTGFGESDSISVADVMEQNKKGWARFDFKLITDPVVLLPGVNVATKKVDGSVRYYGDWEISIAATDSTDARSGIIKGYESFDFDENGKIVFQQFYGDITGIFWALTKPTENEEAEDSQEM